MGNKASSLAKSQGLPSSSWPDGTPRSTDNDFTRHLDGQPSIFANPKDLQYAAARSSSAAHVERQRALGIEPSPLHNLSRRLGRPAKGAA